jgi:hypothetical protein
MTNVVFFLLTFMLINVFGEDNDKTLSVTLMGGLGNRLFQIASAYGISKKFNRKLIVDSSAIWHNPHESQQYIGEYIIRNFNKQIINKNFDNYLHLDVGSMNVSYLNLSISNNIKHVHLTGYFQSEKYFNQYRDNILELFTNISSLPTKERITSLINKYQPQNKYFIHVRRGDYLHQSYLHNIYNLGYYLKAIDYIPYNASILIFSNDVEWCKEYFKFPLRSDLKIEYVISEEMDSFMTIYLMSKCAYGGIIANSSFSWWGIWLNNNSSKLIVQPREFSNYFNYEGIEINSAILI